MVSVGQLNWAGVVVLRDKDVMAGSGEQQVLYTGKLSGIDVDQNALGESKIDELLRFVLEGRALVDFATAPFPQGLRRAVGARLYV